MSKTINHKFISIEGIEGVGKTTVVEHIKQYLEHRELAYVLTREPGGTPIAEQIRQVLLSNHQEGMHADTELLLMFAGRAQNISSVIRPALNSGKWVISDRFTDASLAYQGGGREINLEHIAELAHWVQAGLCPSHTILLDAPVEIAMQRVNSRGAKDRIENEKTNFFEAVRRQYLIIAEQDPNRVKIIDATQPLEQVLQAVDALLNIWIN